MHGVRVVGFIGVLATTLGAPPAAAARRVVYIGDSMMCGAHSCRGGGVDGFAFQPTCKEEHGGSNENSYLSWCPTLARALEADYQTECCSGNGLVYTDNPLSSFKCDWGAVPSDCPVMPNAWKQRLMCARPAVFVSAEHVCTDLAVIGTEPLNATKTFNPHAVLINLGQNDYGVGHIPTSAVWARAYRAFVEAITGTYNDPGRAIQFFLVCGGMDSKYGYCEDTKQAVVGMAANGIGNVHFLDVVAEGADAYTNHTTEGCPEGIEREPPELVVARADGSGRRARRDGLVTWLIFVAQSPDLYSARAALCIRVPGSARRGSRMSHGPGAPGRAGVVRVVGAVVGMYTSDLETPLK